MRYFGTKIIDVKTDNLEKGVWHYNSSIAEWAGKLYLCYRYDDADRRGEIAIAELDKDTYQPLWSKKLNLTNRPQREDPRLFEYAGGLYVSFCSSAWQHVGEIDTRNWTLKSEQPVRFASKQKMEKNWGFFHDKTNTGNLYCIYKWQPHEICIVDPKNWSMKPIHQNPEKLEWYWGAIRGGSPPVLHADLYWSFFHSAFRYPYEDILDYSIYVQGWIATETTAPFRIVKYSRFPLSWPDNSEYALDGAARVAAEFPGGAVRLRNHWLVAAGANDARIQLHKIDDREMRLYTEYVK